jgi:MFS transporter, OPA family, sugar phosphate sensor protein UhpC
MKSFLTKKGLSFVEKITNPVEVKRQYRYWRIRILYNMYFGYAVFYFTRKSFTFVAPVLIAHHLLTSTTFGLLNTLFYFCYGGSKFLSGVISDRVNARYFMSCGLIVTGVANILFGLSSHLLLFFIFWMINAIFQGWGWPPCAKLLTHWYPKAQRGRWWSLWNTCHNVGGALIPLLVAFLLLKFGHWYWGMIIPGVIGVIMGLLLMLGLRDVPSSLGLPELVEDIKTEEDTHDKSLTTYEFLKKYVFSNRYIWLLAFAYVLVYIIRTAINDWGSIYLNNMVYNTGGMISPRPDSMVYFYETIRHMSVMPVRADDTMSFFEVGGFIGSLAAGWLSDLFFRGRRGQTNVLFTAGVIVPIFALWFLSGSSFLWHAVSIFFIGFFIFGPQMLIGVAAAELSHKKAAGAATGFVGLFGYLGAALTGLPMSFLYNNYGWNGFFEVLIVCAVLALCLLAFMWNTSSLHHPALVVSNNDSLDDNTAIVGA